MVHDIKMVAVDVDGTFVRSDYTYVYSAFPENSFAHEKRRV